MTILPLRQAVVIAAVIVIGLRPLAIVASARHGYGHLFIGVAAHMDQLWSKLAVFRVDSGDESLSFLGRLARDNGWTDSFAAAAFEEYKRFIYLAVTSDTPTTPSDVVDQVWHLHLCYTRSYWEHLCAELIGRPLHHGPTRGGPVERRRYREYYGQTLRRYREVFGQPAAVIWPPVEQRFADAEGFVRLQSRDYWLVPKHAVRRAGILGAPLLLLGCVATMENTMPWPVLLVAIGLLLAICFVAIVFKVIAGKAKGKGDTGCAAGVGTDSYDTGDSGGDAGCAGCGS